MAAAIEVQQFAEAGSRLAPAAVATPRPLLGHQARALERLFHEGVAELDPMLAARLAEEVADIEAVVVRAIEMQQPLDFRDGGPFRGRRLAAAIQQPVIAVALEAQAQAPNTAGTAPEDVGGLEPRELPTECPQDDLLDLHGALHGADGVGHGHLLGDHFSAGTRLERS